MLKRLMGVSVLDLTNSSLVKIGSEITKNCIEDIVILKFNHPDDNMISHNYNQIKSFLNQDQNMKSIMECYEKMLVNRKIYIRDPVTENRIPFNSMMYLRLLRQVRSSRRLHQCLQNNVRYQQLRLLKRYFS